MNQRLTTGLLLAGDLVAVRRFGPSLPALARGVRAPHRWVDAAGADRVLLVLAEAAVWFAAAWLGLGLVAALGRALPGRIGQAGDWLARRALPAALYRLCATAVGVSVLVGPAVAGASAVAAERPPGAVSRPVPAPTWPQTPPEPSIPQSPQTRSTPPPAPSPPTPPAARTKSTGAAVTVQPGDSLWLIAARRLGAHADPTQIEATWREWYAANRALIGADPDLIHPGQVLVDPGAASASTPSSEEAQ